MKRYINPPRSEWDRLCTRHVTKSAELRGIVAEILPSVKERGDDALREFALRFDGAGPDSLRVSPEHSERRFGIFRILGGRGARRLRVRHKHVLPTNGAARGISGVSVDTFVKKVTFQKVTAEGLSNLASVVARMAQAEGLDAHARAVLIRQEVLCG